jgi:hypothetical protein
MKASPAPSVKAATAVAAAPSAMPATAATVAKGLSGQCGRYHDRGQATFIDPKVP